MLILGTTALLGSALVGGVFFAFSSFVMKSFARLPNAQGIAAMLSINVVVINPSFLGAFMGTAVLSLGVLGLALARWGHPSALLLAGAAVAYLAGTFIVTLLRNVPLNNRLASVSVTDPAAHEVWNHYLDRWTMWNHIRTVAAIRRAGTRAAASVPAVPAPRVPAADRPAGARGGSLRPRVRAG